MDDTLPSTHAFSDARAGAPPSRHISGEAVRVAAQRPEFAFPAAGNADMINFFKDRDRT